MVIRKCICIVNGSNLLSSARWDEDNPRFVVTEVGTNRELCPRYCFSGISVNTGTHLTATPLWTMCRRELRNYKAMHYKAVHYTFGQSVKRYPQSAV